MRMKLNRTSQLLLAAAASLLAAGWTTACSTSHTIDYVYATSAKAAGSYNWGEIDIYAVDSLSGAMTQISYSPFPSMGKNPVASAVSTDYGNLYVANNDDHTIARFVIGPDGKLYPQSTAYTTGSYPTALAVSGDTLYVLNTYKSSDSCSTDAPCSGSVTVFPLSTSTATNASTGMTEHGEIESALYNDGGLNDWPLALSASSTDILVPEAITTATSGSDTYVYVAAYDSTTSAGYLFSFWKSPSATPSIPSGVTCPTAAILAEGSLCPFNSGPISVGASVQPSAIAASADGNYLYVADKTGDLVWAYSLSSGQPTLISSYPTGSMPSAIAIDPAGKYLYVANQQDSNVSVFLLSNGALERLDGSAVTTANPADRYGVGSQPVAILIDPSMHKLLFTANYEGSSVSSLFLSSDGSLYGAQGTPYAANAIPTSLVAVPH